LDRSDESGCSDFPIDENKDIELNDCNVTRENRFKDLGRQGDPGFKCGSKICLPTNLWCQKTSHFSWINKTLTSLCPEVIITLKNKFLCNNFTFWKDRDCVREVVINSSSPNLPYLHIYQRCRGNSPSQCFRFSASQGSINTDNHDLCGQPITYQYFQEKSTCEDKTDRRCRLTETHGKCEGENILVCQNKKYCLPQDVVCDGYDHCGDGSDEDPSICKVCPRDFGFPVGKVQRATFSCKHRYTGRWICAIPCDGEDDLCEDFEDEDCKSSPFLTTMFITLILLIITVIVSEPIFRKHSRYNPCSDDYLLSNINDRFITFVQLSFKNTQSGNQKCGLLGKALLDSHYHNDYRKIVTNLFLNSNSKNQEHMAKTFFKIELKCHKGNISHTLKCIKNKVGTNRQAEMVFHLIKTPTFLSKVFKDIKKFTKFDVLEKIMAEEEHLIYFKHSVMAFIKILLYYTDMIKDIIFIVIPAKVLLSSLSKLSSFGTQIFCLMWISILLPWVVNFCFLLAKNPFQSFKSQIVRVTFALLSPFAPGIGILLMTRYSIKQELAKLHYRKNPTTMEIDNFSMSCEYYEKEINAWNNIVITLKLNEITFENLIQSLLLILIILLKYTQSATVVGLQELFVGRDFVYIASQ